VRHVEQDSSFLPLGVFGKKKYNWYLEKLVNTHSHPLISFQFCSNMFVNLRWFIFKINSSLYLWSATSSFVILFIIFSFINQHSHHTVSSINFLPILLQYLQFDNLRWQSEAILFKNNSPLYLGSATSSFVIYFWFSHSLISILQSPNQALFFAASAHSLSTTTRLSFVDRELFITHLCTGYCFTFSKLKERFSVKSLT
jgi:hypothetical protein